jgi:[glutamine synthetase] adenylyltransferase / [glutamine synthetase]-adenylyl-L-tyrosine phosphorylase
MSARRPSLEVRLARIGLASAAARDALVAAGLVHDDDISDEDLDVLATAADPAAAAETLAALAASAPELHTRVRADRDWLARVVAVAGASRPLADLLGRGTDAVLALADLDPVRVPEMSAAVERAVRDGVGPDEQAAGIASLRRRATADIAGRDLTGVADVETVARELADLAESVLTGTLAGVQAELTGGRPHARIAVIGMGKLGGRELNYVSDVDVMFVHEALEGVDDETAATEARLVCSRLLELLNASTTMGRAYEVDPTLRPEGRSGALSRTVEGFVAYWQRWAKTWEFQALLKARPVGGDRELGARWLAAAEPFMWPERLDADAVAEVRAMKGRIETRPDVVREGARQLKLGPGGIRDVEFTVQLLQLVHGRSDRSLRLTGTLPTLAALAANGYVDEEDAGALADTYRTLRRVEHALQLANERRTHTVPADPDGQELLARALGYRGQGDSSAAQRMLADLGRAQARVRDLHARIFYRPLLERYAVVPASAAEVSLPGQVAAMGDAAAAERLAALGFSDGAAALRDVRAITSGMSRSAATVRAVLPAILQALEGSADPDGGLRVLRDLVESQGDDSPLLRHLRDHPAAAELLGRVLGMSRLAGELLINQPQGVDWLRDERLRDVPRTGDELARMAVARLHWQDTTAALRRFKQLELLRVVLRDVDAATRQEPGRDTPRGETPVLGPGPAVELTAIAEACLVAALRSELRSQATSRGLASPDELPVSLTIIGMGTLAGRELTYASDLDVVFVHEVADGADEAEATALALAIASNVVRSLSMITPDGTAFDVDADLRPEGRSGALSRSLGAFEAYWERWAEPWEHQALLRVRSVAGDRDLGARFEVAAAAHAHPVTLDPARLVETRRMKARIEKERLPRRVEPERHLKLGPGGISDVEWTVQLLQLEHAGRLPALRTPSTLRALDAVQDEDLLSDRDVTWLREGYRFATTVRNRLALMRQREVDVLPSGRDRLEPLARAMGYGRGGAQALEADWFRHARHVRRVMEQSFYGIARGGDR